MIGMEMRTRRAIRIALAMALTLAGGPLALAETARPDFFVMVKAIDSRSTVYETDFSSIATVVSEDPEEGAITRRVQRYRRDSESLLTMIILEPEVQRGQATLRQGDNIWTYDPESRQFTHVTLEESYQGTTARNSDFNSMSFAEDYRVVDFTEQRLGKYDCWVVNLQSVRDDVTYPFSRIWIDKASELLLQVEDYSLSRRLLRTVQYARYQRVGDRVLVARIIAVDAVVEGRKTQIDFSSMSFERLPDYVFTRAYIERLAR